MPALRIDGQRRPETLSIAELPTHTHAAFGSSNVATTNLPSATSVFAKAPQPLYGPAASLVPMNAGAVAPTGGSQAHQNMQPFLTLTFCIALQGIFPSPN